MPRYVLALDLKNDPALIAEYERYHEKVWPDILASISGASLCGLLPRRQPPARLKACARRGVAAPCTTLNSLSLPPLFVAGAGITEMEIYRIENRLFMIMETAGSEPFDFAAKAAADAANPRVQEWETLMWKYQQALPTAAPGQKWMQASLCFKLTAQEKRE